ncbi:MAG: hypothetical protein FWG49_00495 [Leptospirales bacterium]|nr:hypothetical protein [Leptospirales bacterium]
MEQQADEKAEAEYDGFNKTQKIFSDNKHNLPRGLKEIYVLSNALCVGTMRLLQWKTGKRFYFC